MAGPKPGSPVRGSRSGRPIMALLDLLGRRWALRVLWELSQAPAGFRELQARCDGMSPSVLSQRLSELQGAGVVEPGADSRYRLTAEGEDLRECLSPLNAWATEWARKEQGD